MLSEREREVLGWMSAGKTASETASILGLSRRTVEFHVGTARQKLDAVNVTHVIARAIKSGLIMIWGMGMSGYGAMIAIDELSTLFDVLDPLTPYTGL